MKKIFKLVFQLVAMVAFGLLGFLFVKNWRSGNGTYKSKIKKAVSNIKGKLNESKGNKKPVKTKVSLLSLLTPRQKQVYDIVNEYEVVEMKDLLMQIKGVTERTLRRDLLKLQQDGLVVKKGTTKAVSYSKIK